MRPRGRIHAPPHTSSTMINTDSPVLVRRKVNYVVLRIILATLVLGLSLFKLIVTYQGLNQPVAMDQAQIARQVARGNGFSTQFLRPMELKTAAAMHGQAKEAADQALDLNAFKDTNHPPLNICALAVALKVTGCDRFESTRMVMNKDNVYWPDRVVAATSLTFFLIALVLGYMLIRRLFDELIAVTTVALLALSELMLQYALSGLPQPLMLCCFLGSLHFLLTAIDSQQKAESKSVWLNLCLCFVCTALLCLTSWLGIWVALGLILFCAAYFRPYGATAIPGILIIGLALTASLMGNSEETGKMAGNAFYALHNCFGSGEDLVQRSTSPAALPLNATHFTMRLVGATFDQIGTVYAAMGGIVVAPFFLLCLFNRYKRTGTEAIKWATFCMWALACVGMAIYGVTSLLHASQLMPLFTPLFTAYGIALTLNILARMKLNDRANTARSVTIALILLASSGAFILNLPLEIHRGIWLSNLAHPHYPPYYPAALNAYSQEKDKEVSLVDKSNEQDIIVTDQPWAVAWYSNRKALWMPRRIDDYANDLEPIIDKAGQKIQGFLITPSSHSPNHETAVAKRPGGLKGIMMENGDFAPLMLEGSVLLLVPKHNLALADLFLTTEAKRKTARPLGTIVSSAGQFPYRHFILGTEIIYYSRQPAR